MVRNLMVDYIDLYLIHWPVTLTPGKVFPFSKEDILPMDFKSVWERMEECQRLGLTKAIGVSNFSTKKLENLLAIAKIPPAVNQVISLVIVYLLYIEFEIKFSQNHKTIPYKILYFTLI